MIHSGTDSELGYLAPNPVVGGREPEHEYFGHPS